MPGSGGTSVVMVRPRTLARVTVLDWTAGMLVDSV